MTNFLSFICIFFLIFDLKVISVLGSAFLTLFICFFLILIKPLSYITSANKVFSCFSFFIFSYIVILFFIFFRVLIDGSADFSYVLTTLKTTAILFSTILYLIVFGETKILLNIFNAFFFNSLICIFFGSFPEFKIFINYFQYPLNIGGAELIGMSEYRNAFLAGSGYFGVSALYSLALPVIIYYITSNKNIFNFIKIFFVMVAGVLAGRVALISYFVSFLLFSIFKKKLNLLLVFIIFLLIGNWVLTNIYFFEDANKWISEMYKSDGVNESTSIQDLIEMFYFPNEYTFLFGDAKYVTVTGGYYGGTDVGFMRNILFGGVLYLFLIVFSFLSIFYKVRKYFLAYILVLVSLLLHLKGVFIFNNPGFFPLVLCAVYYMYVNKAKLAK